MKTAAPRHAALEERAQPGKVPAVVLAVIVHAIFFGLIIFGVRWQNNPTPPIEAELWDKLPPVAAKAPPQPPPPEPEPPKVEPKPEPPAPPKAQPPKPEPPKPDVKPEPPKPDPEIALKAERERKKLEVAKKKAEAEEAATARATG